MKKCTTTIGKMVMVAMLFMLSSTLFAQTIISGKVANAAGNGVQGVTVTVKGTSTRTQTDAAGDYSISAPQANSMLVFSSVGFTTIEVAGNAAAYVIITNSTAQLDDIVVVAYGTKKKSDLTSAVTSVSAKDFQKGNINSSEQLLQGKVAGLQVTSGGGEAGGGSKIRIRGAASLSASNDPLIVIDGVPVEGNGIAGSGNLLSTINPNDIESMSVLKDASAAALYGSRATNGVIIITTKKGTSRKFKFNFSSQASLSQVNKNVDVLTGDQIRSIVNANGTAEYKSFLGNANTNWQDAIYQNAKGFDNNLSAAGIIKIGTGFSLPMRLSVGYLSQEGVLLTNKFDRFTSSLNLSPKFLNDHLSFNINAKFTNNENRFADGGAIGSAVSFDPTQPIYNGTTNYGGYYEWEQSPGTLNALATRNPVSLLALRKNTSTVDRFIGNVQMDYKMHFLPDLHLLVNVGIDKANGSGTDLFRRTSANSIQNFQGKGRISTYRQEKESQLADVQLFYQKDIKSIKTKLDVLVGHSFQDFYTNDFSYVSTFQDGTPDNRTVPTFPTDRNGFAIDSYLGRINLNINNKYLITGSIRRDASSRFSPENRVGYFPAVSAAWKLREEFFKGSNAVSDLKLRGSYGETGQQDGIGLYNYLPIYSYGSNSAQYQIGNQFIQFLRPSSYNPDFRWETTATANVGLDFGFAKNRITGTVDVYEKKTRDLLSVVPIPAGANFNIELFKNVGNLTNRGAEFSLNLIPVRNKNITWEFGFNVAYNETKITKLLEFQEPGYKGIAVSGISGGTGNNIGRYAVGYAPFVFYTKVQVYDNNGKPIEGVYEDLNRDGDVNGADDNDRRYYKKPAPDAIFGVNTSVTIKQFTLGASGHGMLGNYLYNNFNSNNGVLRTILNPVKHIGNAAVNYLQTNFTNNRYISDYYVENASFFRLDNINLAYNVGKIGNNTNLRLSANVQNVFVWTKYSGTDPENSSSSGVDNNIYPRPIIYTIGANLDF